jgi:hypothetical protein
VWTDELMRDYQRILQVAFYDDSVAEEIASDEKFAKDNPEEAYKENQEI